MPGRSQRFSESIYSVAKDNPAQALSELEDSKRAFGQGDAKLLRDLRRLSRSKSLDAEDLIRFHEALLFLRAYPISARVSKLVEQLLKTMAGRVSRLRRDDVDLAPLDAPEVSGIVGTSVTSNFSYALVSWLVYKYPTQLSIDWDWIENEDQMAAVLPRFLPLLDDEAMVEAHVSFREWLRLASRGKNEVAWLVKRFESLQLSGKARAQLYDSLKLHVTWKFGAGVSRTTMRRRAKKIYFHQQPLIARRDVSLVDELNGPLIPVKELSRTDGERIVDMARETSAVRYRELHGFTYGDQTRVLRADLGRGTDAFLIGVPPEHRLPLRGYHAALILKNGVPASYFEGLSIFERMESGFNLYYTFRDGETAWLYARVLHLMRQLVGVTVFSIDPYQIGHENEEGIESGAFWFYRKLGFRPVQPELLKLTLAEEEKLANDRRYRTPARILRKLASGHMLFEAANSSKGEWDRFSVRNIGLAVQRRMAREFDGDSDKLRAASMKFVRDVLLTDKASARRIDSFGDLSLVLAMAPQISRWSEDEKRLAVRIMSAKSGPDETQYLKQMQKHASLRALILGIGSGRVP